MTSGEVYNLITGGSLRQQTEYIRQLQAGENKKEEVDAAKRKLGGILPHAVFSGGRVGQNAESHTGCLMFDIDHCKTPARDVVRLASQLPYVLLATVSVRGEGVHVIVRADVCLENHTEVYKHVAKIITAALGEEIDPACKDLSRVMFLSHDAEAYYNPNACILHLPHTLTKDQKNNSSDNQTLTTDISRYLDAASITMTSGSRHTQLTSIAGCLVNVGFDMDEAISECVRRYAEPDFGEKEIESVIRGIYNKGRADFGKNRKDFSRKTGGVSTVSTSTTYIIPKNEDTAIDDSQTVDIEDSEAYLPTFPKSVYENLPSLLRELLPEAPEESLHDINLLSVLTILGSVMPNVKGNLKRISYYPTLFVGVIGESGSGKGSVAPLQKLVDKYHRKIYRESLTEVKKYENQMALFDAAKEDFRKQVHKKGAANVQPFTMEEPDRVYLRDLSVSGYTSAAKLDDMLTVNYPYTTLFYETELETIIKLGNSDFGMYNDTINKTFHHEKISSHTIARGARTVNDPKLSFFFTGTPGMLRKFITDTENGTYPRLLPYRLRPAKEFIPLTDEDDDESCVDFYEKKSEEVLRLADFLMSNPTQVRFSASQRGFLNSYLGNEYKRNYTFGHRERNSIMQRGLVSLFRIAMILTALRKYEGGWYVTEMEIDDRDFATAFEIFKVCMAHSYFIATSLPSEEKEIIYRFPDEIQRLFVEMPDVFYRKDIVERATHVGVTERRIDAMLKKCLALGLLSSESRGLYRKTDAGKCPFEQK